MTDKTAESAVKVLAFVAYIVAAIPLYFFSGWVLAKLWGWFVVPLGVVPITLAWAVGLSVLVGLFRPVPVSRRDPETPFGTYLLSILINSFLLTLIAWVIGGIALHYMPS